MVLSYDEILFSYKKSYFQKVNTVMLLYGGGMYWKLYGEYEANIKYTYFVLKTFENAWDIEWLGTGDFF